MMSVSCEVVAFERNEHQAKHMVNIVDCIGSVFVCKSTGWIVQHQLLA